jgi:hypothetical protein
MSTLYHNKVRAKIAVFVSSVLLFVWLFSALNLTSARAGEKLSSLPSSASGKIHISQLGTVQLISETGSIPLTITNDLDKDVVLRLEATSSDSNRLEVWALDAVYVGAKQDVKVALPIHAKANGVVNITTHLKAKNIDFGVMSFEVHITRAIGDVVSAFFVIVIALLLILGVLRTIRAHKRMRGKTDAKDEGADI